MFKPFKNIITATLLLFSMLAFAFDFDLKIPVDDDGNPAPDGIPFYQCFHRFSHSVSSVVISIDGYKHTFGRNPSCKGISKNHPDVINWEMEKTFRCVVFKLSQVKDIPDSNSLSKGIFDFLQFFPEGCESVAPAFYLWQYNAAVSGISTNYNFWLTLDKMGSAGKKYAKILEDDGLRPRFAGAVPESDLLGSYGKPSFEKLISNIRNVNFGVSSRMSYQPEFDYYEQVRIMQMLKHKSPLEIVKYLLDNNIIKPENFSRLTPFLGMCPELPPEAVEFLKKQYLDDDQKSGHIIRDEIVVASLRNKEMARWLKPYMAEFIANRKVCSKAAVAYMLISGKSDPMEIVRDCVYDPNDFIYEYAHATGNYEEAYSLIEKIKPYRRSGWGTSTDNIPLDYAMLYDKSDLSLEHRMTLLRQRLDPNVIKLLPKMPDGSVVPSELKRFLLQEALLLHPDNLPALLALMKEAQYASNAWTIIKAFSAVKMPTAVAEQYFALCMQESKSQDVNVRKDAIWSMRFFTADEQRSRAVKLLLELLLSNNRSIALTAATAITAMGPACIPELLETVGGSEPYLAVRACELIGGMGLYGQKATPELIKQLNASSDWMLKTVIIKTLALIKGSEAIPEIEKYVSAKQPMLAETAKQALILLKPIPDEILKDPREFFQNNNNPSSR